MIDDEGTRARARRVGWARAGGPTARRVATPRVGPRRRDRREPFEHDSRTASGAAGRPAGGSPGVCPRCVPTADTDLAGSGGARPADFTGRCRQPERGGGAVLDRRGPDAGAGSAGDRRARACAAVAGRRRRKPRLRPVRRHGGGGRPRRGRPPAAPRCLAPPEHVTRRRTRTPHGAAVLESAPRTRGNCATIPRGARPPSRFALVDIAIAGPLLSTPVSAP